MRERHLYPSCADVRNHCREQNKIQKVCLPAQIEDIAEYEQHYPSESQRYYFIKKKYLSPFDEEVELWKRTSKQGCYFVVAGGMLIKGIIVPERDARAQIAAEIKEIANMM